MKNNLENDVVNAVGDYLAIKRYFYFRANNTPIWDGNKNTFRRMPKHSRKGVSDFIVVHKGKTYFLELKSKTGKQSDDQKTFQQGAETAGAIYCIIRSIEDVQSLGL